MKANIARFPVFINGSDLADDVGLFQSISVLLPAVNQAGVSLSGDFLILPEGCPIQPTQRLLVLVPENEINENELARRIWKMAAPASLSILLLSVSTGPQTETYLRRRLATLAAITGDEHVQVRTTLAHAKTWAEAVRDVWRSNDLLVCYDSHSKAGWSFQRREIGYQLAAALNAPVYFLAGLKLGPSLRQRKLINTLVAWPTAIVILVAFGWLQFQIDLALNGWISTVVLIFTVLVEIVILFILNALTS